MTTVESEAGRIFVREVMIVARRWRTRMDDRLRALGMSQARYAALIRLAEHPEGVSQATLAELAGVEPATLVRIIDTLESQGHLERRPAPGDRRVNILSLTPQAEPLIVELERIGHELGWAVMGDLDLDDLRIANAVLQNVRAKLDAEPSRG